MNEVVSPRNHTISTLALCLSVFAQAYLLISVFPYSGFMVIELIDGLNEENAGSYAGLLASSFMIGRACSSYGWGKLADLYGRVPVLIASLLLECIFSVWFGLSTSFTMALIVRFLLGVGSGILTIARTSASELAYGNRKLETKGMSMVMGMLALGYMIAPAISGVTAEPIQQYPDWEFLQQSKLLAAFPFFLPNIIGALLCLISIVFVWFYVDETLPEEKIRDVKHLAIDTWSSVRHLHKKMLSTILEVDESIVEESTRMVSSTPASYGGIANGTITESHDDDDDDESDLEIPQHVLNAVQDDIGDAIRASIMSQDESVMLLSTASNARSSIAHSITRRSTISSQQRRASQLSQASAPPATVQSLWAQANTRYHMEVYWIASFVMVAGDEAFPLFCISQAAGLGLPEKSIGTILSASGLLFLVGQYVVYGRLVEYAGLYGSIRIGSLAGPFMALIPISLWLNRNGADGTLTWQAFLFLTVLLAVNRVLTLCFYSSIAVATNRTVLPSHRGTMNGLNTVGGSVAKGLGPIVAGLLVSFSFSSGLFVPPQVGAVFLWLFIGVLGCLTAVASYVLLDNVDDEEDYIELQK